MSEECVEKSLVPGSGWGMLGVFVASLLFVPIVFTIGVIDLFPPIVALAAFADGVSSIIGAKRLTYKESNRAKTLQEEFGKAGVRIVVRDDEMKVYPGYIRSAIINSHNDHRIAMAAAILGLAGDKITIRGAECVAKSFPDYFERLIALGANIHS